MFQVKHVAIDRAGQIRINCAAFEKLNGSLPRNWVAWVGMEAPR